MSEFLEGLVRKHQPNTNPETKRTIYTDRWDRMTLENIQNEMSALAKAGEKLEEFTDTAHPMMDDTYLSLLKALPRLKKPEEVRGSYRVNHAVMTELRKIRDYNELRKISIGDNIGAGLAAVSLEPELEKLFDKMEETKKQQKELEELLQQMQALQMEMEEVEGMSAEDMMANAPGSGGDSSEEEGEGNPQNWQEYKDLIEQQMKELQKQIDAAENDLDETIEEEMEQNKGILKDAISAALSEASDLQGFNGWGLQPGSLHRVPAQKRIELAAKLKTQKFKRMADIFGRIQRAAIAEQQNKIVDSQDEIYDLEIGSDIRKVLPSEMMMLGDELMQLEWFRRFSEHSLLQYALHGTENVAKGGILILEDGSGSMSGDREIWAKAIGLALLKIAMMQKRPFYAVHFGGPGEYKLFDYDTSGSTLKLTTTYNKKKKELTGLDGLLDYAETFFGGGPLRLDQRVVTPSGWKEIGEIEVGDQVYGVDGTQVEVMGVYPQGKLDLYEVTFRDGAKVICDGTHIWTVREQQSTILKDLTLNQMLESGLVVERKESNRYRFSVPVASPVELPATELPIDPYLMGYLLGDGTLGGGRSVMIHSSEEEHPWRDHLPEGITTTTYCEPTPERCGTYGLKGKGRGQHSSNSLLESLKEMSLLGVRGSDKFVPEVYLWGSIAQRFELLCGLLDSDGTTLAGGGFSFDNTSLRLAEAVVHLAQSLGGVATLAESWSRESEQTLWTVRGRISSELGTPFKLSRKINSYRQHQNEYVRSIVSAERVETSEAICIKVNREDGLFLTEGFVVTHNTDFHTPMSVAMDRMKEDFKNNNAVGADIVFLTDGMCGIDDKFMKEFAKEQERLGFRIFGINIGGRKKDEPLYTICDGKVINPSNLSDAEDVRSIFRKI